MRLIFPERPIADRVICFTTTRAGGYSQAPYDSFNLATHVFDSEDVVEKNRQLLFKWTRDYIGKQAKTEFPVAHEKTKSDDSHNTDSHNTHSHNTHSHNTHSYNTIMPFRFLNQIHSPKVVNYTKLGAAPYAADAVYSKLLNTPLTVLTADCLPIVLASKTTCEYAAVHAGWKGLLAGVVENTVKCFNEHESSIAAWIGPSICQRHFEVGNEVVEKFKAYPAAIIEGNESGKWHIDLKAIASKILLDAGIKDIQGSGLCTYCSDELFSFRQASHQGASECGRMATIVVKY